MAKDLYFYHHAFIFETLKYFYLNITIQLILLYNELQEHQNAHHIASFCSYSSDKLPINNKNTVGKRPPTIDHATYAFSAKVFVTHENGHMHARSNLATKRKINSRSEKSL